MIADNLVGEINQVKELVRQVENVQNPNILEIRNSLSKEGALLPRAFRASHKKMEFKERP